MKKAFLLVLKFLCILYGSCFFLGSLSGLRMCFIGNAYPLAFNIVFSIVLFFLGFLLFYVAFKKLTFRTKNADSTSCNNMGDPNSNVILTTNSDNVAETMQSPLVSPSIAAERLRTSQEMLASSIHQLNETLSSGDAFKVTVQNTSAPKEVLDSMRAAYSPMQVQNDIRLLNDCINLMKTTNNLNTFFSRYNLAMQKSLLLEQAKQSGINVNTPITSNYIISLKNRAEHVLQSTYNKELIEINALKTLSGKRNRIDKFLSLLAEYLDEFEFSDTYHNIISNLNLLKKDLEQQ